MSKRTPPPWSPHIGEVYRDWNGHLWIGTTDMVAWVGWKRGGPWAWLKERHQKAQRKAGIGDGPELGLYAVREQFSDRQSTYTLAALPITPKETP